MTEEATEYLVKIYLESMDYFVKTNERFRVPKLIKTNKVTQKQTPSYEIDIIAINTKKRDKIIGEVKGWNRGLQKIHFTKLYHKKHKWQDKLRIVNDKRFRRQITKLVKKRFGENFRLVIYCHHINEAQRGDILKFAKREKFDIVTLADVLEQLEKAKDKFSYSNDPVLQLLRIQKSLKG